VLQEQNGHGSVTNEPAIKQGAVPFREVVHLHLDPLGGLAGDMFLAAVLDAWPELYTGLVEAMRAAGLPDHWSVARQPARDHGLTGSRLSIAPPEKGAERPTGNFREIRARLEASQLVPKVLRRTLAIFTLLAEAEARVHGGSPDEVHFHEIADWDSVADIVGAAHVIELFERASWSVGPLPLGSGRIRTSHGPLPVPAPATVHLLEGFPVMDDGVGGERVTPTGAAILRALEPSRQPSGGTLRIATSGYGFGTRRLPGLANALRLLAFTAADDRSLRDQIAVMRFEVDDQTPEDLSIGLARIAGLPVVRDVCQWPVFGKKGRVLFSVQILCDPSAIDRVAEACFEETTTIGLRWHSEQRAVLFRDARELTVDGKPMGVKRVIRPRGTRTAKAEADDIAQLDLNGSERAELRRKAEAAALEGADE
jgi:uncharacterized protein (TIGR00299 family) protein